VGRKRKHFDPLQPLPRGLFRHRQQYRAKDAFGKWHYFRGAYLEVLRAYGAWREEGPVGYVGSVGWMLDLFVGTVCPSYIKAGRLAERTVRDYTKDAATLKAGIGKIPLAALMPSHVADFRDVRAETNPSHVRNELACLSAAMSYAVEKGYAATNPCLQVRRPTRIKRQRLITDAEYLKVYAVAEPSVRLAMTLAVRTLALPGDLLRMGPHNIVRLDDGRRILRFARGKTKALIEVEIVGELARAIDEATAGKVRKLRQPFVHTQEGKPYTVDGIGAMFRRYCGEKKANVKDFGLRDLRAKGATDMYRAGAEIRPLQNLLGHGSETTTRIYIKGLLPEIVRPNERPIVAVAE
jgi:integrase